MLLVLHGGGLAIVPNLRVSLAASLHIITLYKKFLYELQTLLHVFVVCVLCSGEGGDHGDGRVGPGELYGVAFGAFHAVVTAIQSV